MRIEPRAFGIAAGLTAAILFVLCAAAVAVAPQATTNALSFLVHMDLSGMARSLTWASFVGGLVAWTVGVGLTFVMAARIYNRVLSPRVRQEPLVALPQ